MVYLVDDDVDDLQVLEEVLLQSSYSGRIRTALNGKELMDSLEQMDNNPPAVIVLDLNMPLKDGFSVLKEMKGSPLFNAIPIVILTASANKKDEERCYELGCTFFFRKPIRIIDYEPIVKVVKRLSAP